jgi:citronellol/citronellal dehydrogenase
MARAALVLATEPLDKVTGWVTYSQTVLKQYGMIGKAAGIGVDFPGSGYSQMPVATTVPQRLRPSRE